MQSYAIKLQINVMVINYFSYTDATLYLVFIFSFIFFLFFFLAIYFSYADIVTVKTVAIMVVEKIFVAVELLKIQ